jgi:hypothetical protein
VPDVLIPYRPSDEHRARALEWVSAQWDGLRHRVIVGEPPDGPWCKAAAVADALTRSTADTLIVADADVWPADPTDIARSVEALEAHGWAIPHTDLHRLDVDATDTLIATGVPGPGRAQRPYLGYAGGGIVVLRRDTYESCPLDPRFLGWGQEDMSWALALGCLAGQPWRGRSDLWHLWHPSQPRMTRQVGNPAGVALHRRYRAAAKHPDTMRTLIEEAK